MADIELELVSCPTCKGQSIVNGERCPERVGRGVIRVPHAEVVLEDEPSEADEAPALETLKKADLIELAERRGLDTSGTKAEIIERIHAADAAKEEPAEGEPPETDEAPAADEPAEA